jgi:putative oxidoreductase
MYAHGYNSQDGSVDADCRSGFPLADEISLAPPDTSGKRIEIVAAKTADLGLLALRTAAGAIAIGHGYTKLFGGPEKQPPGLLARFYGKNFPKAVEEGGPEALTKALTHLKFPVPPVSAYAAGLGEFAGGLGLLFGLGGRLPGLAVTGAMLGAVWIHREVGLYGNGGGEFAALLGAAAAALAITGPGELSLDQILKRETAE